jgi:hypothetical protein
MDGAKQQWALEHKKQTTDTPTGQELDTYVRPSFGSLKCPAGGVYTIHSLGEMPTCSIPGHELPSLTTRDSL